MLNGTLNLFIGLALTFGCISLMVSTVTEALAAITSWRARTLLSGLKALLNDGKLSGLALDVLNHAGANPLSDGRAVAGRTPAVLPAYIQPLQFAAALIDSIHATSGTAATPDALRQSITAMTGNDQIRTLLLGMLAHAGDDLATFRTSVASWFGGAMERLSGRYKRNTQLVGFVVGLVLATALNVDAIRIAHILWAEPRLAAGAIPTGADPNAAVQYWLGSFPLGWFNGATLTLATPLGWLLTAAATLFGAPFWFDTLQRFVQVRSSGSTPTELARQGIGLLNKTSPGPAPTGNAPAARL